jgi:hypothetical protein
MKNLNIRTVFAGIASSAVIVVAVIGFVLSGTPQEQRLRRTDEQRIMDLQNISYAIDQYWFTNKRLPTDLETLSKQRNIYVSSLNDPASGLAYEYIGTTSSTYDLCATFDTDSAKDPKNITSPRMPTETFWFHPIGRNCFKLDIQKDKFAAPVPVSVD